MKLSEVAEKLGLAAAAGAVLSQQKNVEGCYVSDMLSDVLANAKVGNLWVTRQTHPNVVAVASIKELSGIVVTAGKPVDPETVAKADAEGVAIFTTDRSTFEVAGTLFSLLDAGGEARA